MSQQDDVNRILQAYLKTGMTERQFEALVTQAFLDAEKRGAENASGGGYDKGFSDGYDSAIAERKNS
jgi:hypothetical protein